MKKNLKFITNIAIIILLCYGFFRYLLAYTCEVEQKKSKLKSYYYACNQWIKNRNSGIKIEDYLNDFGYKNIAVYGLGELGSRLCEEICKSNIDIKYTIDQGGGFFPGIPSKTLNDTLENVDLIIVTAIYDYDNIRDNLIKINPNYNVVSLEKILLSASAIEE